MIPQLSIGGLTFNNYYSGSDRLDHSNYCIKYDGIIGSNIMKSAVWKIDKEKQILTISNSIDNVLKEDKYTAIPFTVDKQLIPWIKLNFKNQVLDIVYDTGFNQKLRLKQEDFELLPKDHIIRKLLIKGNSTRGQFVKEIDTTYMKIVKLNSAIVNNIHKDSIMTYIVNARTSNMGIDYFNNRYIVLDWFNQQIHLSNIELQKEPDNLINYGFNMKYVDGKIMILELYENSEAIKKLNIQDQVMEINGIDFSNMRLKEWCLFETKNLPDSIDLKIKRGTEYLDVRLYRETFL